MKLSRPEAQENYFLICSSLAPVYTSQPQFYTQLVSKPLYALHLQFKFEGVAYFEGKQNSKYKKI